MPRNFSELKSGGTIPMLSPLPEKWGDASPVPHRSTPVYALSQDKCTKIVCWSPWHTHVVVPIQHSSLWAVFAFLT